MSYRNLTGWAYVKTIPRSSIGQEFKGCAYDREKGFYTRSAATERSGKMAEGEMAFMADEPRFRKSHTGMHVNEVAEQAKGMADIYVFNPGLALYDMSRKQEEWGYVETIPSSAVSEELADCARHGEDVFVRLENIDFHGRPVAALVTFKAGKPVVRPEHVREYVGKVAKESEGMADIRIREFALYP